ncbi:MAG: hypothetical protein UHW99_07925 [Methanobrevibacter sp.]|nr:hypothetical protein [Methanobrevibacter sp.]
MLKEKNFNSSDLLYISCETTNFAGQTDIKKIIGIYLDKIHNTTPALLDKPVSFSLMKHTLMKIGQ